MRLPGIRAHSLAARGLVLLLAAAACGHSEPFGTSVPDPLGPASAQVPRQVTYNLGDDRSPTVSGSSVVYSRRVPGAPYGAACIAVLPAAGGTLAAEFCPPEPSPADTFVSNWLEPTLSPDGTQLAFVWRRSARVSALGTWTHDLIVASADAPGAPLVTLPLPRILPDGRFANTAMEVRWTDDTTVRYLATNELIVKVKDGGASRFTDTTLLPYALMELNTRSGESRTVTGADSVTAYADDGAGGAWIVWGDLSSSTLMHLAPDGTRTPGPDLPFRPTDLDLLDGTLVIAGGTDLIACGDPTVGSWRLVVTPGPSYRVSSAPEDMLVVEVERGEVTFGAPANLWLLPVPR